MLKMIIGLLVVAAIFIPLERVFALKPQQKILRKGWLNDVIHFLLNKFLVEGGLFVSIVIVATLIRFAVSEDIHAAVASQPWFFQFIEALLLTDFCAYWMHRWAHHHPFLWKLHAVHHSIEDMDWLATSRLHPLDLIIRRSVMFMPIYILGFSKETIGLFAIFFGLWTFLIHSNTRISFGPFKWIIGSPEFHHWHHTKDAEGIDKNFAGLFPFIDLAFGTLHMPKDKMPKSYGVTEVIEDNYLKQLIFPFQRKAS